MLSASCVGFVGALCALLMTWLSAFPCAAQHDPLATARSEMAHFKVPLDAATLAPGPRLEKLTIRPGKQPWLIAAASTTAALAASYLVLQGFSYKASSQVTRATSTSRDLSLDLDSRLRGREQLGAAQDRANLISRITDICLAGTVAATGATLLIWLTAKRKREARPMNTLLGPMVLRGGGGAGGGLLLRNKF
ncbi:MAG: hypothetical protein JWN04_140 [Myxococcaceae bacterium]|nr:hypothetical protein [Myxococcaceae bacterium]